MAGETQWAAKMRRLRERPAPQRTLRVCDDEQVRRTAFLAAEALERARHVAKSDPDDEAVARRVKDLEPAHVEAQRALAACSVRLTFRALPRPVLEELISAHPPTEEQAAEGAAFNPDTFPTALMAAASVDGMSEAEATELYGAWPAAEANALWEAAWQVQQVGRTDVVADVGKG
ncbi:hypothetical protein ACFCYF_38745 [Streptomyces chartreusis]|uniref:hypothetical protein n=1 Tax=Streptomyces chartreusis TaxID=1969 RepID=UPI0035E10E7A